MIGYRIQKGITIGTKELCNTAGSAEPELGRYRKRLYISPTTRVTRGHFMFAIAFLILVCLICPCRSWSVMVFWWSVLGRSAG